MTCKRLRAPLQLHMGTYVCGWRPDRGFFILCHLVAVVLGGVCSCQMIYHRVMVLLSYLVSHEVANGINLSSGDADRNKGLGMF